jgi:hypothetical protein
MKYYDRLLELISEVKVTARKVEQKPQEVKKYSTGRNDYRKDQEADRQDARRILRSKSTDSNQSKGAAFRRATDRRQSDRGRASRSNPS